MLFFFATVTVILPAIILAGVIVFAVRNAVENRRARVFEHEGHPPSP
jgi:hypothetical protein